MDLCKNAVKTRAGPHRVANGTRPLPEVPVHVRPKRPGCDKTFLILNLFGAHVRSTPTSL